MKKKDSLSKDDKNEATTKYENRINSIFDKNRIVKEIFLD